MISMPPTLNQMYLQMKKMRKSESGKYFSKCISCVQAAEPIRFQFTPIEALKCKCITHFLKSKHVLYDESRLRMQLFVYLSIYYM